MINNTPKKSIKLFVSVDIIDSTLLKNNFLLNGEGTHWADILLGFYRDLPKIVLNKYISYMKEEEWSHIERPYIWKNIGDEIVFICDLEKDEDVYFYIQIFKDAIDRYHQLNNKDPEINVKLTAWTAESPVTNIIMEEDYCIKNDDFEIKKHKENEIEKERAVKKLPSAKHIEFVGPSTDLGFRISKYATKRQFIISVEATFMLLQNPKAKNNITMFFEKEKDLKGVLIRGKYPILWIDMYNNNIPEEERLYGINRSPVEFTLLEKYCKDYIKKYHKVLGYSSSFKELESEQYINDYNEIEQIYNDMATFDGSSSNEDVNDGSKSKGIPKIPSK